MIDKNINIFFFSVFKFPFRGFEECAGFTGHDFDGFCTEAQGCPATIHGGVSNTNNQNIFPNFIGMFKRYRFKPINPDVNAFFGIPAAGQV